MNVNKIIHEAMGLCWHENVAADKEKTPGWFYCIDCGVFVGDTLPIPLIDFPDYTEPVNYCALMDWLLKDDRARSFGVFTYRLGHHYINYPFGLSRPDQLALVAKAIEAGVFK